MSTEADSARSDGQSCPAVLADRFRTLRFDEATREVVILDRKLYPFETIHRRYTDHEAVALAIEDMVVQGGPPLAYAAGLALVLASESALSAPNPDRALIAAAERLLATRPTADDLHFIVSSATDIALARQPSERPQLILRFVNSEIARGNRVSQECGRNAAALLDDGDRILTHCIPGAALCWMLWEAKLAGKQIEVVASETRPYFQGSRLTAQCCVEMGIACKVITDGMSAHLMQTKEIDKLVTAADRIAMDGHIANKIGTLQHAIAANYFDIPFYVLGYDGPDRQTETGNRIKIELRSPEAVLRARGKEGVVQTAVDGITALYPAFDVTPPELIAAIITDRGTFKADKIADYFAA